MLNAEGSAQNDPAEKAAKEKNDRSGPSDVRRSLLGGGSGSREVGPSPATQSIQSGKQAASEDRCRCAVRTGGCKRIGPEERTNDMCLVAVCLGRRRPWRQSARREHAGNRGKDGRRMHGVTGVRQESPEPANQGRERVAVIR